MARKESLEIKASKELTCVDYLFKFNGGVEPTNLPTTETQRKNCRRLLENGIMDVFTNALEDIDPKLEIYLSDDFSQICLGKKDNEKQKALMAVGTYSDIAGAKWITISVGKNNSAILASDEGVCVLRRSLKGVISGFKLGYIGS